MVLLFFSLTYLMLTLYDCISAGGFSDSRSPVCRSIPFHRYYRPSEAVVSARQPSSHREGVLWLSFCVSHGSLKFSWSNSSNLSCFLSRMKTMMIYFVYFCNQQDFFSCLRFKHNLLQVLSIFKLKIFLNTFINKVRVNLCGLCGRGENLSWRHHIQLTRRRFRKVWINHLFFFH